MNAKGCLLSKKQKQNTNVGCSVVTGSSGVKLVEKKPKLVVLKVQPTISSNPFSVSGAVWLVSFVLVYR